MTAPVKRSVTLAGHRTSISLEEEFWDALHEIAAQTNQSVNGLIAGIDAARPTVGYQASGLSSAVRLHILAWYRDRA
ncbi:MAG: aryl-sulfate sulfotransferase [Alphaproteobacteria bacterium]|nr:aryl-sulfate sulfotransferase [Alphaproteobacteria bacterium]